MFSGPLLPIFLPLLGAAATFFTRRWPRLTAGLGALFALALWLVLRGLFSDAVGEDWTIYGQSFVMGRLQQQALLLVYLGLLLLYLWQLLWPQPVRFVTWSLAAMAPLTVALTSDLFSFGVVALFVAAGLQAILIQTGRAGSTLAAGRYAKIFLLALIVFLVAGWMLQTNPAAFLELIVLLLLLGFLLVLAGFPFYLWVPPLIAESRWPTWLVVLGLGQWLLAIFLLQHLVHNPLVQGNAQFIRLLQGAGVGTALAGGLLSLAEARLRHLAAYFLLLDMGGVLASLAFAGPEAYELTLQLLIGRLPGLVLLGVGLARLQPGPQAEHYHRKRLAFWLVIYGAGSLLGLPLTPGFFGRWAIVGQLADASPLLAGAYLLALGLALASLGRALLNQLSGEQDSSRLPDLLLRDKLRTASLALLLFAALVMAILPGLWLDFAERMSLLF